MFYTLSWTQYCQHQAVNVIGLTQGETSHDGPVICLALLWHKGFYREGEQWYKLSAALSPDHLLQLSLRKLLFI